MEEREGIRRVWFDRGHKILRQVLWEWIAVLDRLAFEWREDPGYPWWYNERASVSTLAAAVWRGLFLINGDILK